MSDPIVINHGDTVRWNTNRPVRYRIEFRGGSYIEGTIPAGVPLTIHQGGDITKVDITVDEDSMSPVRLVDDPE